MKAALNDVKYNVVGFIICKCDINTTVCKYLLYPLFSAINTYIIEYCYTIKLIRKV